MAVLSTVFLHDRACKTFLVEGAAWVDKFIQIGREEPLEWVAHDDHLRVGLQLLLNLAFLKQVK